jgi:hypothetical protein
MGGVWQIECQGKWPVAATSGENETPPLSLKSTLLPTVAFVNARGKMNHPCYPCHPWLKRAFLCFIAGNESRLSFMPNRPGVRGQAGSQSNPGVYRLSRPIFAACEKRILLTAIKIRLFMMVSHSTPTGYSEFRNPA